VEQFGFELTITTKTERKTLPTLWVRKGKEPQRQRAEGGNAPNARARSFSEAALQSAGPAGGGGKTEGGEGFSGKERSCLDLKGVASEREEAVRMATRGCGKQRERQRAKVGCWITGSDKKERGRG